MDCPAGAALRSTSWGLRANRGATFASLLWILDLRAALNQFGVLRLLDVDQTYPTVAEAAAGFQSAQPVVEATDRPARPKE